MPNQLQNNDIDFLKQQLNKIIKWINYLNQNQNDLKKRILNLEAKSGLKTQVVDSDKIDIPNNNNKIVSLILIILGVFISLIPNGGILLGLPLLIMGGIIFSKNEKLKSQNKKPILVEKENFVPVEEMASQPTISTFKEESTQSKNPVKEFSFEEDVGMKWFAHIGILALVVGVGFFIRYAIDMEWINHLSRIILGICVGIGLIIFGELMSQKTKYLSWAQTLIGGGVALTYFVIYGAYHFLDYRLAIGISQLADIALLSLVIIFAILISIKYNSQIIATESFFLGYITSLLSNNFENMTILYGLLLTIGLVVVVSYKKWSIIGIGGLFASYLMYMIWSANNVSFGYSSFILISYFVAFAIQSICLMGDKKNLKSNIITIIVNSALFFSLYYFQIEANYPDYSGLFAVIFSIFYLISYYFAVWNFKEKQYIVTNLYLLLLYLTLTILIQFNREWITIIWSLETLFLTALFLKLNIKVLKNSSFVVGFLTALKTLVYDFNLRALNLDDLFTSTRLLAFLATIICFFVISKLLKKRKEVLNQDEAIIPAIYSWTALVFLIFIIFVEFFSNYFNLISIIIFFLILIYIFLTILNSNNNLTWIQLNYLSTVLWLKTLIDLLSWEDQIGNNLLLPINRYFTSFLAIGTIYALSWYVKRKEFLFNQVKSSLENIYSYGGTILIFILIMTRMKEFEISMGWSVLALIIMVFGFVFSKKFLRMQGMLIFGVTIFKVFVYDIRNLETIYRTFSYIVLGLILLLVSFIYTKYKERLKDIL